MNPAAEPTEIDILRLIEKIEKEGRRARKNIIIISHCITHCGWLASWKKPEDSPDEKTRKEIHSGIARESSLRLKMLDRTFDKLQNAQPAKIEYNETTGDVLLTNEGRAMLQESHPAS